MWLMACSMCRQVYDLHPTAVGPSGPQPHLAIGKSCVLKETLRRSVGILLMSAAKLP